LWLDKKGKCYKVIRTRDPKVIERADIVYDIGKIYNPSKFRFDHHQKEGAGKRENGIPYASFGLVWKEFGLDLCNGKPEVVSVIDKHVVQAIDASDNGVDTSKPLFEELQKFSLEDYMKLGLSTWKEKSVNKDKVFMQAVQMARRALPRIIEKALHEYEARLFLMDLYAKTRDKRILDVQVPFSRGEIQMYLEPERFPELIYAVFKEREENDSYKVLAISKSKGSFDMRKGLPESWRGLEGQAIKAVTGFPDVRFCHSSGFLSAAESHETALKLAEKALAM
jgi:uncharacterized UPF0160 family protein